MWFKLVNANFTTNLGTMSSLSNSWGITWSVSGGIVKTNCPGSVAKGGTLNATLTLNSGASLTSITSSSGTLTKTVSGTTVTVKVTGISANCTITVVATGGTVAPTNYTFTINPTPTSATVTLSATGYSTVSGTGSKSITVANGTKVSWSVSANGYTTRTGNWTANENKTMPVTLTATGGGGTLNEYIGYDELAQYVKFGNVQTDAVNDTSDVITVSKNGATGDLELAQTNADGKYTVCFLNLPLTVGSEVNLTATNYAGEMAPNAMIGIDSNISTFPVANTWKNQAGTAYIAASHIYMQPSSTTNKNSSYLERGTNRFVGCSPAIGCWSVTASTSDYTAFSEFTLKVLDVGFAIYKNGSLIATVNSSKSNTYIDNTTLPAYFMISCAASAGYKISIKSVKVA